MISWRDFCRKKNKLPNMKKLLLIIASVCSLSLSAQEFDTLAVIKEMQLEISYHIAATARMYIDSTVVYDPSYVRINYPMGDVPSTQGVCTDLVIRVLRDARGIDLQEKVHDFRVKKGLPTDTNIDHRRVRNLVAYFDDFFAKRNYKTKNYHAGNIIVWDLGGGQLHIGICVGEDRVVHNWCCGQVEEDISVIGYDNIIRNYSFVLE